MLIPKLLALAFAPFVLLLVVLWVRDARKRLLVRGFNWARDRYLDGACPYDMYDTHSSKAPFDRGVRSFCSGQIAFGSRVK